MKKEVIIAIVSGLILGLIITFGIYTANRSLSQQKAKEAQSETPVSPSPTTTQQKTLTIVTPEPNDLVNQSELTVSGVAWPEAVIAIISETNESLIQADEEGVFSLKLELVKGFNELKIIATDESGETQSQNLIVTYSTSEIEPEPSEEPSE
jgi:hypothetical protein